MKMNKIAVGIALAAGTMAAQAADVLMFPHVVNSPAVTTIVSVVDTGNALTSQYNNTGLPGAGAGFNRLHWRLHFKNVETATSCSEIDFFLPTSPNDLQTVDLGNKFAKAGDFGVLFNDPSNNNNFKAAMGGSSLTYALAALGTNPTKRGVLFVHNSDTATTGTPLLSGEALVFEFATGAGWGYAADQQTGAAGGAFNFIGSASANDSAVTFMPIAETTTSLMVTPVAATMLGGNGTNIPGWDTLSVDLSLEANETGGFYDRDENAISGAAVQRVACVGRVNVADMLSNATLAAAANGGWANLQIDPVLRTGAQAGFVQTTGAVAFKLEANTIGVFNSKDTTQAGLIPTFNNTVRLPAGAI